MVDMVMDGFHLLFTQWWIFVSKGSSFLSCSCDVFLWSGLLRIFLPLSKFRRGFFVLLVCLFNLLRLSLESAACVPYTRSRRLFPESV